MRLIVVLILTGCILLTGCTTTRDNPVCGTEKPGDGSGSSLQTGTEWTTYADNATGFLIRYPVDWDYALADMVDEKKNLISTNVYFKPYTADGIVLSISARNGSLAANRSVEMQVKDEIASLDASGHPFTIVGQSNLTISNYPAAELAIREEDQGIRYYTRYLFVDAENQQYVLYSKLPDNQTSRYKPLVDQAIASFQITG
jgi:PsbP-like protein